MRPEIRTKLKERREEEISDQLEKLQKSLVDEGFEVFFGSIGQRTTYAFLKKEDKEIVGYTYIKDLQYKSELVGKYKALQQAITRKTLLEQESADEAKAPKNS